MKPTRRQGNEYGRSFLQEWLIKFKAKWKAIRETCDGLCGPGRDAAEARVQARIAELFMGEFVAFANAVVRVFGMDKFDEDWEPPERTTSDRSRYAQWLTDSDDTMVAARRIVLMAARAGNPDAFRRNQQVPRRVRDWATQVFVCAPQEAEPDFARTIHQWIEWVSKLIDRLEVVPRLGRDGLVTSMSGYRQWEIQNEDGHAIHTDMIIEPVVPPCPQLVNMNWEFDLIPVDLSVAAAEAWFEKLLALPTADPRSGGLLYWWEAWPSARIQDSAEILRDAYRLTKVLAAANRWIDAPHEPTDTAATLTAHEAIGRLETVRRYLRTKVDPNKHWLKGVYPREHASTCTAERKVRSVVPDPDDSEPPPTDDDLFTVQDAASWLRIKVKSIYNKLNLSTGTKKPTAIHKAAGRCRGRYRFDELRSWLAMSFPRRAAMIPRSVEEARQLSVTAQLSNQGSRAG